MNIQSTDLLRGLSAYKNQAVQPKRSEAENKKNVNMQPDEVILSNRSAEMNSTMKQIRDTIDLRQELVEQIKTSLRDGSYYVGAEEIADKIIEASKVEL
ncbi:MAG: flagellar biosynthesis anti-sigma factor FlgM [Acidaminococcales bacterium]|jgi:flagellar biosynthesis anti-sigma factor FlgM|nr:flagellar biosynthesis anti-sigma factor FlgM [Acidaminococcales bacterium]